MQDKKKMAVIIIMSAIVCIITLLTQLMLGQRAQDEQSHTPAAQTETAPEVTAPAEITGTLPTGAPGTSAGQTAEQPAEQPAPESTPAETPASQSREHNSTS